MGLNKILFISGLGLLLAQLLLAGAIAAGESGSVNLIIKMEQSPDAEGLSQAERENLEMNSTINLLNEVDSRGLMATIAVTGDIANKFYPLYVTALGTKENHELIMAGMSSGEPAVSFEDQDARLRKSKRYVEDDYVCGGKQFKVAGYLPQPDSFNASAYQILDDLELSYLVDDAGLPQSQGKTAPYQMDGFAFYVVPVSASSGQRLLDSAAAEAGYNGTQWYDLLANSFDEASGKGESVVAVFTNTVSGSGEYLDAYKKFVEYAVGKGAKLVTTKELVEKARMG